MHFSRVVCTVDIGLNSPWKFRCRERRGEPQQLVKFASGPVRKSNKRRAQYRRLRLTLRKSEEVSPMVGDPIHGAASPALRRLVGDGPNSSADDEGVAPL